MQIPLKWKLSSGLSNTLSDLATYVETGDISAEKQKEKMKKK